MCIEYALHSAEKKSAQLSPQREAAIDAQMKKLEASFEKIQNDTQPGAINLLTIAKGLGEKLADDPTFKSADSKEAGNTCIKKIIVAGLTSIANDPDITLPSTIKRSLKSTGGERINQTASWDCGPTAHAIALAPLVGIPAAVLAAAFRQIQKGGHRRGHGMSWENPERFVEYVNRKYGTHIKVIAQGEIPAKKLAEYREKGCAVTASFRGLITKRGHITAFGNVDQSDGVLRIENLDPNRRNIARGLTQLTARQIDRYSKQAWVFSDVA